MKLTKSQQNRVADCELVRWDLENASAGWLKARRRAQRAATAAHRSGLSISAIATALGVTRATATLWIDRR